MCNPTQFGEGFLRSNKAIIVNQTTKPSFVIKRRGIDDNNSGRNIFTENWIWRLFARGDELKKNVDWYLLISISASKHSVNVTEFCSQLTQKISWNQLLQINQICREMISRNIFKLELIRVSSILCYIFGDDIIVIALFHKQIHFLLRGIEFAIKWNQHHFTQVRLYWKT